LGKGLTTPHRQSQIVTKYYTRPRNRTDYLERPR